MANAQLRHIKLQERIWSKEDALGMPRSSSLLESDYDGIDLATLRRSHALRTCRWLVALVWGTYLLVEAALSTLCAVCGGLSHDVISHVLFTVYFGIFGFGIAWSIANYLCIRARK